MRIITVTLNPAIDKTVYLSKFEQGGCNRIEKEVLDAGGKGINVSKTLMSFGKDSTAIAFVGGNAGYALEQMIKEYGFKTDFIRVKGETRTNLKIVEESGCVTELNEPGPEISEKDLGDMLNKIEQCAGEDVLFVLSGSVPKEMPPDIYGKMIRLIHKKGARVILDTSGEAFAKGLEAKPDVMKPNKEELLQYRKVTRMSEEAMLLEGKKLLEKGVQLVVISLGEEGALFISKEECFKGQGPKVEVCSTVGAGDAMVAAFAYGISEGMSVKETAKMGLAVSAGAVMTYGTKPAEKEIVEELLLKVQLKTISFDKIEK